MAKTVKQTHTILEKIKNAKHILVIKLRYIGDSVWLLCLLENLKLNIPNAKLSVLINEGTDTFFHNCSYVDKVIAFPRKRIKSKPWGILKLASFIKELRTSKPDVIIELTEGDRAALISLLSGAKIRIGYRNEEHLRQYIYTHNISSKINTKHMVDYHLDVLRELGLKIYSNSIKINTNKEAFTSLKEKIPSVFHNNQKKRVLIHPGARGHLRRWNHENFAYLCDALSDKYRVFLVTGANETSTLNDVLHHMKTRPEAWRADLSLDEFAALCELSDLFIGNDSGPIHIAATKTYVVGIYGPTLPDIVSPWTDRKLIFFDKNNLLCRPCRQDKCYNSQFKACLENIRPDYVVNGVIELLARL
ncbi:MAG: glycosyltransferase family 9 protein [Candidatus Loosdrechtia sp.]|uniref:glycosyltransferase family 9 protein n=1 Tax=Candidatus Loosdrechtia sp. TaxID=3101272 RepID=UPI003A7595E1|nr:MAG: glycosyltransferase family 9 protein [Candidatus Jettenia sp. AMX2]